MKQKDFTFPDVEKIKREIVTVGGFEDIIFCGGLPIKEWWSDQRM